MNLPKSLQNVEAGSTFGAKKKKLQVARGVSHAQNTLATCNNWFLRDKLHEKIASVTAP